MIARLRTERRERLVRHEPDREQLGQHRADDDDERHPLVDRGIQRGQPEQDHQARGDRRRHDRQRTHPQRDRATQPSPLELGAGRLEDLLRRRGEPSVGLAELVLLAGASPGRARRAASVRRRPRAPGRRAAPAGVTLPNKLARAFDDPDAAHHRLLEDLGRDRLGGAAEQHGALEGVDGRRRRVLRDDRRPARRRRAARRARTAAAQPTPPSSAMAETACSHPQVDAKYEGSNGVKVPCSKPTAMVMFWYGSSSAVSATTSACSIRRRRRDGAGLGRPLVAPVAGRRTGQRRGELSSTCAASPSPGRTAEAIRAPLTFQ